MKRAISFDLWWQQITGQTFPVDVTSIPAAAERDGELYLALNGGAYFAVVLWAAPGDANRDRVVEDRLYYLGRQLFEVLCHHVRARGLQRRSCRGRRRLHDLGR